MGAFPAMIGGSYVSQSPIADCEDLMNLIIERMESPGAQAGAVLYPTPGVRLFGTAPQAGGRAFFSTASSGGRMFSVHGVKLYEWLSDGTATERATVAIDGNPAQICWNGDGGNQIGVCSGGNFYCMDLLTNVVTQVAFLNGKATMAGFISGYFLVFDVVTGTVYQSDLYDGLTFDPLNFFQRNTQADDWAAMFVASWSQVFLPGTKTRDYYYNSGAFPIPFAPAQSGLQSEGIAATFSVCEAGRALCWLMTTNEGGYRVMAAQGYKGERISNHAMEFAISNYTRVDDAIGSSYEDQGHPYYLLKFPTANVTWCYDFSTGIWHKRGYWNSARGVYEAWRLTFHAFGYNKHLWVDDSSGNVYQTDVSFPYDVDETVIRRERTSPAISINHQMLDVGELELLMQVGVGNLNPPGDNPMIILQISYDGGMTWGRQRAASVGRVGDYTIRVRWQGNGSGRNVAFRLIMTDPIVNWRIVAAYLVLRDEQGREVSLGRAA